MCVRISPGRDDVSRRYPQRHYFLRHLFGIFFDPAITCPVRTPVSLPLQHGLPYPFTRIYIVAPFPDPATKSGLVVPLIELYVALQLSEGFF